MLASDKRMLRAEAVLKAAEDAGCTVTVKGPWVKFSPPCPVSLLPEAMELTKEIGALIWERKGR